MEVSDRLQFLFHLLNTSRPYRRRGMCYLGCDGKWLQDAVATKISPCFSSLSLSLTLCRLLRPFFTRLFEDYDRWYDLGRYRLTRIIFEEDYNRFVSLVQ